jgi:hypothetical protein
MIWECVQPCLLREGLLYGMVHPSECWQETRSAESSHNMAQRNSQVEVL